MLNGDAHHSFEVAVELRITVAEFSKESGGKIANFSAAVTLIRHLKFWLVVACETRAAGGGAGA